MEGDNTAQTKNAAGDYEKIFIVPRSFYDGFGANIFTADKVSVHLIVSESTANNVLIFLILIQQIMLIHLMGL